jgi:hypothetical protein
MTTTRCRPGDLAIITRDEPGYQENIGRIVEVHGPARQDSATGTTWLIVPVTRQPYAVMTKRGKLYSVDAWMLPIRGDELEAVEQASATTSMETSSSCRRQGLKHEMAVTVSVTVDEAVWL